MSGKLYGVGVGPGDPELLTIKALKRIKESDIIAIPTKDKEKCVAYSIVLQAYPELKYKDCIQLDFPMTKDIQILERCNRYNTEQVATELEANRTVAFLTLGDPTIYSTYSSIHRSIREKGYEVEIVNGIPSFLAIAAKLGISLAEKDEEIHIVPATYGVTDAVKMSGTKILMKAGKKLKEIKVSEINARIEDRESYIAMVENCGMLDENIGIGIENIPDVAGYYTTVIIEQDR